MKNRALNNWLLLLKNWIEKQIDSSKETEDFRVNNIYNAVFVGKTTIESLCIYENFKFKFEKEIKKREDLANAELDAIDKYRTTRAQRLKNIIQDPIFDMPVNEPIFVKPE